MVELLAGECQGGGSQHPWAPGLKSYKGDKRETVPAFRGAVVWGSGEKRLELMGHRRHVEALSTLKTGGRPGAYATRS